MHVWPATRSSASWPSSLDPFSWERLPERQRRRVIMTRSLVLLQPRFRRDRSRNSYLMVLDRSPESWETAIRHSVSNRYAGRRVRHDRLHPLQLVAGRGVAPLDRHRHPSNRTRRPACVAEVHIRAASLRRPTAPPQCCDSISQFAHQDLDTQRDRSSRRKMRTGCPTPLPVQVARQDGRSLF